jgi:hypothetical protein
MLIRKRGQLHTLKPGSYVYGHPPPSESMNKPDSSIPRKKEKHTHRMHYFQHVQHGKERMMVEPYSSAFALFPLEQGN